MVKLDQTSIADEPSAEIKVQTSGRIGRLSVDKLEQLFSDVEEILEMMRLDMQTEALTLAERFRLLGAGVKRYGFIDKVSDTAAENPRFAPIFFNNDELKNKLRAIEILRSTSMAFSQMQRISDDLLLQVSDEAFQMALSYYNTVREASRRRQPGAQAIFKNLQSFFSRKRRASNQPTVKEVERDARALLHGRKEGKIIIENERPHMVGGKHVVVDEINSA